MTKTPDQRFSKKVRLRKQSEFDCVYRQDHFAADNVLVIRARRTSNRDCCEESEDFQPSRLGLSISKKVGNAVVRNRWKRLIREGFRTQRSELPAGLDFVVRPRKGAVPEFFAIARSLKKLLERLDRKVPPIDPVVEKPVDERSQGHDQKLENEKGSV